MIGIEPAAAGAAFVPDQGHVLPDSVDVDLRPGLRPVIFGDEGVTVVEELEPRPEAPPEV
jgi:hypothetical protein